MEEIILESARSPNTSLWRPPPPPPPLPCFSLSFLSFSAALCWHRGMKWWRDGWRSVFSPMTLTLISMFLLPVRWQSGRALRSFSPHLHPSVSLHLFSPCPCFALNFSVLIYLFVFPVVFLFLSLAYLPLHLLVSISSSGSKVGPCWANPWNTLWSAFSSSGWKLLHIYSLKSFFFIPLLVFDT